MMPLSVEIAEKAIFPAAERIVGHRCSNTNVDTNITSICFISKLPGSRSATRKKTCHISVRLRVDQLNRILNRIYMHQTRSEEHTSELQSRGHLVCRLLLEKKTKHR